jgi:hypothetical protein
MRTFRLFALVIVLFVSGLHAQAGGPRRFQVKQNGKWGFIDSAGNLAISAKFSEVDAFSDGLAAVQYQGKWGYIDESGTFVIPPRFNSARGFDSGYAGVEVDGFWGFIDKQGKFTISPQFDTIICFDDSPPAVSNDGVGYWQYVNETRTGLSPVVTNIPWGFSEGLTPLELGGKEGYVDLRGHFVIPPQFEEANGFSESLAAVKVDGKWGAIDKSGQLVIQPQFDWITGFSEGLAVVEVGHKNGIIRKDGSWVIPPTYPFLRSMIESRAAFSDQTSSKWGFLDETGNVAIKPQFDKVWSFEGGLAMVEVHGRLGYIDPSGRYIWNPTK